MKFACQVGGMEEEDKRQREETKKTLTWIFHSILLVDLWKEKETNENVLMKMKL